MNNNDDESDIPHRHNFSALDRIRFIEPTPEEIQAKQKKDEALIKVAQYEMLYHGMHELMLKAALDGEDLDRTYETLKHWLAFM